MGHLFVVQGDITRTHCDAWLLPTDAGLRVADGWVEPLAKRGVGVDGSRLQSPAPAGWSDAGIRAFDVAAPSEGDPAIIAVNTGGYASKDPAWYIEGVLAALNVAASMSAHRVCLPAVGMGEGGKWSEKAQVLEPLLLALRAVAASGSLDVVLVAREATVFAASQRIRRSDPIGYWPDQTDAHLAERLARYARDGRLVLFLGAGIGREVSLPAWDELLNELADGEVGDLTAFGKLAAVDRARVLETRLGAQVMRRRIVERLRSPNYVSLAHALLASLPIREVVTTNYDDLFEQAAESCGRPVAVLPYQSVRDADRWLLKLHGDVTKGDDIVITRDDYFDFPAGRRALTGIVQSLLITRHMLFVGFSLRDDNFHQIAYDVRKATPRQADESDEFLGTALFLEDVELLQNVWGKDLEIETMGDGGAESSGRLLVLLDRLLAEATTVFGHLLDTTFDGLLSDDERAIRKALETALELARSDESLRSLLEASLAPFGAIPSS